MAKKEKGSASLNPETIWALLDDDEQKQLLAELKSEDEANPFEVLQRFPTTDLLGRVVSMRGPFIRMLQEFCELLTALEAATTGNVRFVLLPEGAKSMTVDFGPQLRGAVATALNRKWLDASQSDLLARINDLHLEAKRLSNKLRPRNVERLTSFGRALSADPILSNLRLGGTTRHSSEYHPVDAQRLRELIEAVERLETLYERLVKESAIHLPETTAKDLKAAGELLRRKSREATARIAYDYPKPPRSGADGDYLAVAKRIDAVREGLLAVSDFASTAGTMFDFMNLEIWRQRWRIYELWLLARFSRILTNHKARMSSNGRVADGQWRLKYTKDSLPVLTFMVEGIRLELFYQLFQTGLASNDMPDIALKIAEQGFVVVADPKHGKSYSRKELAEVCERYDHAFQPNLTCVVNYFDATTTVEELDGDRRKLLVWGLRPFTEVEERFDAEISAALKAAWTRFSLPKPTILVLFDISESTRKRRDALKSRFVDALRAVFPQPSSHSLIALFGSSVVAQSSLESASAGLVDFDASDDSTNLEGAMNWAIDALAMQAGTERQLWLFTDGDAEFQFDMTANRLQETELQIRVYEATSKPSPTTLQLLCERTGGVYYAIAA